VAAGAGVRVVYATDGDNNPWAQRATERRLRIRIADRARFGARRRAETLAALDRLAVPRECAHFLAFPDQGLTGLLMSDAAAVRRALAPHLSGWRPTLVAGPTAADLHPDHSALAVLARLALAATPPDRTPRELACLVHNPALRHHGGNSLVLSLTSAERERKRLAIECHASQLHLRGPWLRSFGGERETFLEAPWPGEAPHPVTSVRSESDRVIVAFQTQPRVRSFGARALLVVAERSAGVAATLAVAVPLVTGAAAVRQTPAAAAPAHAAFTGGPWGGELSFPAGLLAGAGRIWVKLERRFGFFDEAGWLELTLPDPAPTV
jgi:hypothetical protein